MAQFVVIVLDAKGVVTTPRAELFVAMGVLAGLAIALHLIPSRIARTVGIGATGMLTFYLLGLAVHGPP